MEAERSRLGLKKRVSQIQVIHGDDSETYFRPTCQGLGFINSVLVFCLISAPLTHPSKPPQRKMFCQASPLWKQIRAWANGMLTEDTKALGVSVWYSLLDVVLRTTRMSLYLSFPTAIPPLHTDFSNANKIPQTGTPNFDH